MGLHIPLTSWLYQVESQDVKHSTPNGTALSLSLALSLCVVLGRPH
jgi:hypothetical protein